jgi:hypothetical protein
MKIGVVITLRLDGWRERLQSIYTALGVKVLIRNGDGYWALREDNIKTRLSVHGYCTWARRGM